MSALRDDIQVTIKGEADPGFVALHDAGSVTAINGVRMFDVGQGDCIGILDQDDSVFCYLDYGGCSDHPDKSNPAHTASRMSVTYGDDTTPVVLTHWDKDHDWSASKKNPAAPSCDWLVPRQEVSPTATGFAAGLTDAHCWPESAGVTPHRFAVGTDNAIEIRKCGAFDPAAKAENRNLTGLAANVDGISNGVDASILLAGDCHFDAVAALPGREIKALVAYHHGSGADWTASTATAVDNRHADHELCDSFGKKAYAHPARANYDPEWNLRATSIADVRAAGHESTDMKW